MVNIVKVAPFALGAAVAARAIIRRGRGHARAASASATPPVPPVVRHFSRGPLRSDTRVPTSLSPPLRPRSTLTLTLTGQAHPAQGPLRRRRRREPGREAHGPAHRTRRRPLLAPRRRS